MKRSDIEAALAASPIRLDANETSYLSRELIHVQSRVYETKYAPLKARQFLPPGEGGDPGAETLVWQRWDSVGRAKVVANHSDDLPKVDAIKSEGANKVRTLGDSFSYSVIDIRRSAKTGVLLNDKKAMAARRAAEATNDEILALGAPEYGIPSGMLNDPDVDTVTSAVDWDAGATTAAAIIREIGDLVEAVKIGSEDAFIADTILFPPSVWKILRQTINAQTDRTIFQVMLDTFPEIRNVDTWHRLETAGASGKSRIVAYTRDPEVLTAEVLEEFTMLPPQARNLAFEVPCMLRTAGCAVRFPIGMKYMDDVTKES